MAEVNRATSDEAIDADVMKAITELTIKSLEKAGMPDGKRFALFAKMPVSYRVATLYEKSGIIHCDDPGGFPIPQDSLPDYLKRLTKHEGIDGLAGFGPEAKAAVEGMNLGVMVEGTKVQTEWTDDQNNVFWYTAKVYNTK